MHEHTKVCNCGGEYDAINATIRSFVLCAVSAGPNAWLSQSKPNVCMQCVPRG